MPYKYCEICFGSGIDDRTYPKTECEDCQYYEEGDKMKKRDKEKNVK